MPAAAWWRKRWDSNPRALSDNRISSAARYDHFDTLPQGLIAGNRTTRMTNRPVPMEVPPGFEPGNEGFADLCLTTWLWHQIKMER